MTPGGNGLRGRAGRAARRLREKLHTDVHVRLVGLSAQQTAIEAEVRALGERLGELRAEQTELRSELQTGLEQLNARLDSIATDAHRAAELGRLAYDEEPANRRRVNELRRSPDYELAFTEAEPLVSFLVPTYDSHETLRDVALPSILGQTYSNLEVIVIGDNAPPGAAEAVAAVDDPRVVYLNRTIRGPYAEDSLKRWYTIGVPPVNEGLAVARGRWIAILGDDDEVRPNHTEVLLAAAQRHCYEHCYGRMLIHGIGAEPLLVGEFPPAIGQWGLQAAIYHSGLRFFEGELGDAIHDEPSDWSKCRRMMRAGVRFGMVDETVVDKHGMQRSV